MKAQKDLELLLDSLLSRVGENYLARDRIQSRDCPASSKALSRSAEIVSVLKQDGRCRYKYNSVPCACNHFCSRQAISITYSERVSVAFIIQYEKHMHHIILLLVVCLALPCFFHIISQTARFSGNKLLNIHFFSL
jgi:hypothetical protein